MVAEGYFGKDSPPPDFAELQANRNSPIERTNMTALHFFIVAIPLAAYILLIGIINLQRRPLLTTGSRDAGAIGIAISGLVVVGPMGLFFPEQAAGHFGSYVWLLLLTFYGLCVSLVVLLMQPRLIVYNLSPDKFRPIMASIAMKLDPTTRWSGDSLCMPKLGVHMLLDGNPWTCHSQLISVGKRQQVESWRLIEKELRKELQAIRGETVVLGVSLTLLAILVAIGATWWAFDQKQGFIESLAELLRR